MPLDIFRMHTVLVRPLDQNQNVYGDEEFNASEEHTGMFISKNGILFRETNERDETDEHRYDAQFYVPDPDSTIKRGDYIEFKDEHYVVIWDERYDGDIPELQDVSSSVFWLTKKYSEL